MNKKVFISFLISFLYVLIGTIVVMVSFPKYEIMGFNHNHPLWSYLVIVTLPVNLLLTGLVMVDNSLLAIITLQTIIFFICWFLVYIMFPKNK